MRVPLALAMSLLAACSGDTAPAPVDAVRPPTQILGGLDPELLTEASGLAISRNFADRLYHHNDSGGGPYFCITSFSGEYTQKVEIEGYDASDQDLEDMAIGPCGQSSKDCLYLGAIGDNSRRRESIEILIIEEREEFGPSVEPVRRVKMRYPDEPHNAEGLAVDPSGDVYVLTKGSGHLWDSPSRLYRLRRKQIWEGKAAVQTLEFEDEINLPALAAKHQDELAGVATAFDISPDGQRFLVLTRRQAYEFTRSLDEHTLFAIPHLRGQEAAAYLPDGSGFVYTQELVSTEQAKIIRVDTR